ncbi:MAG: M20/M25/M40 family metallo-hydrolase, partial [Verrucomicrobiota bacterium]
AARISSSDDAVGTVGKVEVLPGAINSIPNHTLIEIDFRDTDHEARDLALTRIEESAREIAERRGVVLGWEFINADPPAICDPNLVSQIASHCEPLGFTYERMISRAYHDSLFMARLCPTSMIFIPCRNGWSHRPDEYATPEAIGKGTTLLAETLSHLSVS